MIGTDIKLALASMRTTKLRATMTLFAIVIGVAGYVLVTTFVDGLKTSITSQIGEFGANFITVNSGDLAIRDEDGEVIGFDPFAGFGGISTLTEKDLDSIKETEGVEYAAPQMLIGLSEAVMVRDKEVKTLVAATNSDYPFAFHHKITRGQFFEDDEARKVAVIGSKLAEEVFPAGLPLGAQITIRQQKFTIVGLLEELEVNDALTGGAAGLNEVILIPLKAGKQLNGGATSITEIDVQAKEDADVNVVADAIEAKLLENHGGAVDFTVLKQEELISLTGSLLDSVKIVSQSLSYVMLIVGGVVIALIMLITVKERTREIGIRKSIGATNANIRMQFLVEAVVLSWFGSLIGVIIAYLAGLYLGNISDITPTYTLATIVSVMIISTSIGAISGIVPAMSAAKKDPVEALRYE